MFLWLLLPVPAESLSAVAKGPQIRSKSWVLIDMRSGDVLDAVRPHRQLAMASTTKLMTAWVAIHRLPFRRMVRAVDYHGDPSESLMGLEAGERISVRDLLYGLILVSGNDAAQTLAVASSGSVRRFVAEMNRTARRMGLDDTHYENPVGLDAPGHYTSVADLATLARRLMRIPRFRKIARSRDATLTSLTPQRQIESTNTFLKDHEWARGIKTGHTLSSGYSLVSAGRRHYTDLIGATIGAPTMAARDRGSVRLLEYGFGLYSRRVPIRIARPVVRVPVRYGGDQTLGLVSRRQVRLGVRKDQSLGVRVVAPAEVEGPISRGQRLGRARVLLDGKPIATVVLRAARGVKAPTWMDRLRASPWLVPGLLGLAVCVIMAGTVFARRRRAARTRQRLRRAVKKRR